MLDKILHTILQSLISVIVLFIFTRIMGKKQIAQLTFFDYVIGLSIGSVAGDFAIDPTIDYAKGITALVVYASFPIILSYISLKSYRARKLLDGKPTLLIQNGRIVEENLRKTKLNVNELLEECRMKDAFNIADIEFAILETNGKVSVLLKSENQPLTPRDMNIQMAYKGLCLNLVIDGEILDSNLSMISKDKIWLHEEIHKQNVLDIKTILLAYLDTNNQMNIQLKSSRKPPSPFR